MKQHLTRYSEPDELLRVKKSLQFIYEVVKSYEERLYDHVGFSCAIAISKAEELKDQVSKFCPAHSSLKDLIEALRQLDGGESARAEAKRRLEVISVYFGLEKYTLVSRIKDGA